MIERLFAIALMVATALAPPTAASAHTVRHDKPLNCATGPVEQVYSRSKWAIYSCSDGVSLAIVTLAGPAMPFVFFVSVKNGSVVIHGEGTGDKGETDVAYAALKALTPAQVAHLVVRTRSVAN
jgi:hypothetical protein